MMRSLSMLLLVGLAFIDVFAAEPGHRHHRHHNEEVVVVEDDHHSSSEDHSSSEEDSHHHHRAISKLSRLVHHLAKHHSSSSEECEITTPCAAEEPPTELPSTSPPPTTTPPTTTTPTTTTPTTTTPTTTTPTTTTPTTTTPTTTTPTTTTPTTTTPTTTTPAEGEPRNLDVPAVTCIPDQAHDTHSLEHQLLHHLLRHHSSSHSDSSSDSDDSSHESHDLVIYNDDDDDDVDSLNHAIYHILEKLGLSRHHKHQCNDQANIVIKNTLVAPKCSSEKSAAADEPEEDSDDYTYEYEDIFSTTVAAAPSNIKEVIQKFPGKRDIVKMKEDHVTSSYVSQQKAKVQRIFEVMKTMETRDLEDKNVMVDGAWQFVENIFDEMEGRNFGGV